MSEGVRPAPRWLRVLAAWQDRLILKLVRFVWLLALTVLLSLWTIAFTLAILLAPFALLFWMLG
jgi:predicted membrane chloride channel (bestrophin family)